MTKQADDAIRSGASRVDEQQQISAGYSTPHDVSVSESVPENRSGQPPIETSLPNVTLSMFEHGSEIRVRVGNVHNASELYEQIYSSVEEANTAMIEGDILSADQVPDLGKLAGTGLPLEGITTEKLVNAGLKRRQATTG